MAAPPADEMEEVIRGLSMCGRTGFLPLALGGRHEAPSFAPEMAFYGRTRVPMTWLDGTLHWTRVLARRFRYPLDIAEGETRAVLGWVRVLTRIRIVLRMEVLLLTDNSTAAGLVARGRTSIFHLIRLMRVLWALSCVTHNQFKCPWIDTGCQPADGGTRETDRGLRIGPVQFPKRETVMLVWNQPKELINVIRTANIHYQLWGVLQGSYHDVTGRAGRRRFLRAIESGKISTVVWMPGLGSASGGQPEPEGVCQVIAEGISIADSVGTANIIMAWPKHDLWKNQHVLASLERANGIISYMHTCTQGSHYRCRIDVATTRCNVGSILKVCPAVAGTCPTTGKSHLKPNHGYVAGGSTGGGLASAYSILGDAFWRTVGGAFVEEAKGGRPVEGDSRR